MTRATFARLLAFLAVLTLLTHTAGAWRTIFPSPKVVRFLDIDSYFHTRHSLYALRHFPQLLRTDMAVEFPRGQRCDAAGVFDLLIAIATRVVAGGEATEADLNTVAAWIPVILGVGSVLLLGILAAYFLPLDLAIWVVLAFLVYPGTFLPRTSLGFADHHAAEVFLSLATVLGFSYTLAHGGEGLSLLGVVPQLLFLFTWTGAPLYVPIVTVPLIALVVIEVLRGDDAARTIRGSRRYGFAILALSWFISRVIPDAVMERLALKMAWVACVFLGLAPQILHYLAEKVRRRGCTPERAALLVALLAVGAAALPILSTAGGRRMAVYLLTAKTALVVEQQAVTAASFFCQLGPPGILAMLAFPLICYHAARGHNALAIIPAGIGAVVTCFWILAHDYAYQVPPLSALLAGLVLAMVPGIRSGRGRLLQLLLLLPPLLFSWFPRPYVTEQLALSLREITPAWEEGMAWMKEHTPKSGIPPQPLEPVPTGESYGVASSWDRGNFINALGNRWPVFSRFPTEASVRWLLATNEAEFLEALCPWSKTAKVRYVVIGSAEVAEKWISWAQMAGLSQDAFRRTADTLQVDNRVLFPANYGKLYLQAISTRLYYTNGAGLGRLRLVFASRGESRHFFLLVNEQAQRRSVPVKAAEAMVPPIRPGQTLVTPTTVIHDVSDEATLKIFEVVPGAMLAGRAAPESPVRVELNLTLGTAGRQTKWVTTGVAGRDGRFRVRVPYATSHLSEVNVRATGDYRIISSRPDNVRIITIRGASVSEAAVQSGAEVPVP